MDFRILIVSANALSKTANNGKTYRSFLANISSNDIAQFYTGTNEYPDNKVCIHYYRVTDIQMLFGFLLPWKKIKNSHSELIRSIGNKSPNQVEISKGFKKIRDISKNFSYLRELVWVTNKWDNKEFDTWIKEFNPTHIFAVLGNGPALHKVARKLSKKYNIPLSVYFTDDYVLNIGKRNIIDRLYHKHVLRTYKKTLSICKQAFVIGDKMKKAYSDFFGINFGVLVNGISFDKPKPSRIEITKESTVIISYIGGIHLNRWKSIVKLAQILNQIDEYQFEIRVFCVQRPEEEILEIFKTYGINYCGALTPEGVMEETNKSHIMLHVESFDESNRVATHYSISTKIPEYMSSMRGIIAFGPHEIASIEIFEKNNIGCAITDLDSELEMSEKIKDYIERYNSLDLDYQYEFARKKFDRKKMQLINQIL